MLMSDPNSRLIDALGVRWIYDEQPMPPSKNYVLRFEGIAYDIYERVGTVPRAFFVGRYERMGPSQTQSALQAIAVNTPAAPDLRREVLLPGTGSAPPAGPASYAPANITVDHDSTLELEVRSPTAGYVYLADTMYPDGRPRWTDAQPRSRSQTATRGPCTSGQGFQDPVRLRAQIVQHRAVHHADRARHLPRRAAVVVQARAQRGADCT